MAGAIYHRLQGDGVWSAMVPILKEEPDKRILREDLNTIEWE